MLFRLTGLRRYIYGDHQDLSVWDLKHLGRIVRGDGRTSNLKCEAVRRWLTMNLAVIRHEERSSKLLEYTALASRVFGALVDRTRVIEVTPAVSAVWSLWSRFDLDLALHVARRYLSCVPQTKRLAGWRSGGPARAVGAFADLDRVGEHVFDAIKPRDQVARSGWVGFHQHICPDLLVGGDRIALDDEATGWSGGFRRHRAEADVDGVGKDVRHALRKDDTVGRSHRVA
jgi:hypothetical protein